MEHLSLEIFDLPTKENPNPTGSKYAFLPKDASITITDTSEIFASGDVWSHSFKLNIHANAHIFGTAGDMHGARLHEQINKRRARLWVEGLPLYLGYLTLGDEAEIDNGGNVDVTFESGQYTFDEMIEGAKANQVPLAGDVQVGMALWRKRWTKCRVKLRASATVFAYSASGNVVSPYGSEWFEFDYDGETEGTSVQEYPRMVFPNGRFVGDGDSQQEWDEDCVNTDSPYDDAHPYCNVALCYQKYGYDRKDSNGVIKTEYDQEPEAQRGYEYMPANRMNSAPCFYVIYWIRCLMKHLGIYIEENQMMDVEDLRRLFFVNTNCAVEEPKKLRTVPITERYGRYRFAGPGRLVPEYINPKKNVSLEESGFAGKNVKTSATTPVNSGVTVKVSEVDGEWSEQEVNEYKDQNSFFYKAYATSECFPDADISEVIEAIESGFGVRFLFSDGYKRVRIVLLRNIFRGGDVQQLVCDVISDTKVENNIRGFRMTYGDNKDNTEFFYKGFDDKLPKKKPYFIDNSDKHDYSYWDLNATYSNIINKVSAFDKTCYVTPNTGDAYGVKIDKDAKRYDDLHPSLFEYAGYMDAEDGDCTGENKTIETINVGFVPAIMNDLNMEDERAPKSLPKQRFAIFVDGEMRPRRIDLEDGKDYNTTVSYDVDGKLYAKDADDNYIYQDKMVDEIVKPGEFAVRSDMFASGEGAKATLNPDTIWFLPAVIEFDFDGHINEGYRLYLQDNYTPDEKGLSPIESHSWGLTLGIMRGSGSDAYVQYEADERDKEGNDTWGVVPGSSVTAHPDSCDNYGNEWDYNFCEYVEGSEVATQKLEELFPANKRNAVLNSSSRGYISGAMLYNITDTDGRRHRALLATSYSNYGGTASVLDIRKSYIPYLNDERTPEGIMRADHEGLELPQRWIRNMIVELDSSEERRDTLLKLCRMAYGGETGKIPIDNGTGAAGGRFSLKLRAEKPNPYFDPKQEESESNRRYLKIDNENLRQRGLCDQFYKEYSYWVRNARIAERTVRINMAQLLCIDKTVRVTVGDVTGFIRKMQYTVSNQTGLGEVMMEIMYI